MRLVSALLLLTVWFNSSSWPSFKTLLSNQSCGTGCSIKWLCKVHGNIFVSISPQFFLDSSIVLSPYALYFHPYYNCSQDRLLLCCPTPISLAVLPANRSTIVTFLHTPCTASLVSAISSASVTESATIFCKLFLVAGFFAKSKCDQPRIIRIAIPLYIGFQHNSSCWCRNSLFMGLCHPSSHKS